jgi:hypothetical protein
MDRRSRILLAVIVMLGCVPWLAQWRGMPLAEPPLALDGRSRDDATLHPPKRAEFAAPGAPSRASRVAVAPESDGAAVEPRGLVVRLRDPAGTPLDGVHVRFLPTGIARVLPPSCVRVVSTDAAGEASLGAADVEALFGGEAGGRVLVDCFRELTAASAYRFVSRQPLPSEPIDIVIDAAPVYVGALLPSGERWQGQHGVLCWYERGWYTSVVGASPVRIWVVRGEPYLVKVYRAGLHEEVEASFTAITALERERTHDLTLETELAGLRATLLTVDGAPLPADTQVELRSTRIDDIGPESSTRAKGEIRFRVQPARNAAERRTAWLVAVGRGPLGHGRWRKEVTYDVPPPGEWTDLGEVTLEAEPLLVAGRVVMPPGVPNDSVGIEVESIDGDGRWARLPDLGNCVWVDEAGQFAIHGPAPHAEMRIRVLLGFRDDLDEYTAVVPSRTAPGSADVVVRIVEAGAVRFQIAGGADDVEYDQFDVCSDPDDAAEPRTLDAKEISDRIDTDDDRMFVLRRLPPGHVTITLRAEAGGVALCEPLLVPVRAGETTDGGSLMSDDRLRWVELRVTEHEWASADVVRYGPHGGSLTLRAEVRHDGVARLGLRGPGGVDVVVGGDSLAPIFLANVDAPRTVRLQAHPAVTIEVAGLAELAAELGDLAHRRELVVQLTPVDGEPWAALAEPALLRRQSFDVPLDELEHMRRAALLHIAPGRYTVAAALVPRNSHERWLGPEHGHRFTSLGELEVTPEPSRQYVRVQVAPTLR